MLKNRNEELLVGENILECEHLDYSGIVLGMHKNILSYTMCRNTYDGFPAYRLNDAHSFFVHYPDFEQRLGRFGTLETNNDRK